MLPTIRIALQVDYAGKADRYYSLQLKKELDNEPVVFRQPKRIFVLSDIEGNFQSFCKFLVRLRIIDKYLKWTFKSGHLVILGNCFDRNEQATECLWLIYSLEEQARRDRGYVHFILGNYEITGMNGDWRSMHPKYAINPPGGKMPATALYNGNSELWYWLRTKNLVEKIGPILFVHSGIAPALNALPLSIDEINQEFRSQYIKPGRSANDPALQLLLTNDDSPIRYEGYYDGTATEEQVDATLAKFGVSTIVTGHTQVHRVSTYFNGKVINVDTDHANGKSEGLYIKRKRFYRIRDGKRKRIK